MILKSFAKLCQAFIHTDVLNITVSFLQMVLLVFFTVFHFVFWCVVSSTSPSLSALLPPAMCLMRRIS